MKIFVIHSMGLSAKALDYAETMEVAGHETFVPARDTEQTYTTEQEILKANLDGIKWSDECHVLWDLSSLGSVFDMGSAYALGKPIKIISVKKHHLTKFISEHEDKYIL